MYLNKAIIVGNLTREPELKSLPSGMPVANLGVATNRVYKDKEGNKQETAEYHNVIVFGKQAETSAQYLKKGQQVMIEGRLQTRSWDKDGVKMQRTEIVADSVTFGSKSESRNENGTLKSNLTPEEARQIENAKRPSLEDVSNGDEVGIDDIPF